MLGGIFFLLLGFALRMFYDKIQEDKKAAAIDLYTLIPSEPDGILSVNRPHILSTMLLSYPNVEDVFQEHLPGIYLSIIRNIPSSHFLFSFHSQGTILYAKISKSQLKKMEKGLFSFYFQSHIPYSQKKADIYYKSYPDRENRYFSYYQQDGIFMASYSGKLLEEVVEYMQSDKSILSSDLHKSIISFDRNAPFNICIPTDRLDSLVHINDSVVLNNQNKWIATDFFTNDGNICCYGDLSYMIPNDSISLNDSILTDMVTKQINYFFPSFEINTQIHIEENKASYTGCSPLS